MIAGYETTSTCLAYSSYLLAAHPEVQERLRGLSIAQLEDLAEALLDFSDATDLTDWLRDRSN